MKHILIKNTDGTIQVMHLLKQEDGSYSNPKTEISKWAKYKQDEVASWEQIKPEEVSTYLKQQKEKEGVPSRI